MKAWRRLSVRIFASLAAVVAVGAVVTSIVTSWLTASLFDGRMRGLGRGPGGGLAPIEDALAESLGTATLAGLAAALVLAGLVAWVVGRRLLRPLETVRSAAARMARGEYHQPIDEPPIDELAALAADINRLGQALDETEQRRTRLISEVAHEIRSPLTVIDGYIEGILDGVVEPTPELIAAVAEETSRIRRLSEDLATLSRAEEGTLPIHLRPVDITALARAAVERLRPQFEHAGVTVRPPDSDGLVVTADPDRIGQVLTNLLGNALAHTPAGGEVAIDTGKTGPWASLTVRDTGRGIPSDQLERVFERFYRIPQPGTDTGRGIGLTIARSIARAHGGDLVAEPNTGAAGVTMRLTIPLPRP